MTDERRSPVAIFLANLISGLIRMPDLRGAIEALGLFILVLLAGAGAMQLGVLTFHPLTDQAAITRISMIAFFVPGFSEEVIFRGWLPKGQKVVAAISLVAFVAWHPIQVLIGSPFAEPVFIDPLYLLLVAFLGLCCTVSRLRSGSIWPSVVIHWGVVVIWKALFGG
ncbi:MAG: CPBP family glutamic-type intramembrane protease [Alphaproteobacteria bacterium]